MSSSSLNIPIMVAFAASVAIATAIVMNSKPDHADMERVAVNYHITRQCNYSCGFCFHTAKTSHVEPEERAKEILLRLRKGGFRKINFAGGEPFLEPKLLGALCKYAKEIQFESVSIISNGSKLQDSWFRKYGQYVDILGISCDSIDESINKQIGRGKGNHLTFVREAARLCKEYQIQFKLNTVVNKFNFHTDMSSLINELQPIRWKIFQVLPLEGENTGEGAKRDVSSFLITKEEFESFITRNRSALHTPSIMKIEGNEIMQSSYVVVDEYGRFLDSSEGGKHPTESVLGVGGFDFAWAQLTSSQGGGYDPTSFAARDGGYQDAPPSFAEPLIATSYADGLSGWLINCGLFGGSRRSYWTTQKTTPPGGAVNPIVSNWMDMLATTIKLASTSSSSSSSAPPCVTKGGCPSASRHDGTTTVDIEDL
jgi:radical S-adenosyl methionine domain-containing protein 2